MFIFKFLRSISASIQDINLYMGNHSLRFTQKNEGKLNLNKN